MIDRLRIVFRKYLDRLVPRGDLASRTVKSGFWNSAINIGGRALQITLLVVLARLLAPADFGLLGIALLVLAALEQFSRLGLAEALIQQEREDVGQYFDTAWTLMVARGVILGSLLFFAAPLIASVFSEPRVTPILRVVAIVPLLRGLENPGMVYFRKNLEFHKQFTYQMSGTTANFIVAISLALLYQSVWALVIGTVAAAAIRLFVSYRLQEHRPGLELNVDAAKELIGFGKWITADGIIYYILKEGDDAFVGWFLTTQALGFYQMAYRLGNAPSTEVTQIVSGVMFPVFSKLQSDEHGLREAYHRMVEIVTFVSFPMAAGIILVTPAFVASALGTQWLPMVTVMQVIGLYSLVYSFNTIHGPIWKAIGRPDIGTKIGVVRLVVLALILYPATDYFGLLGTAAAVLAANVLIGIPMDLYFLRTKIGVKFSRLFRTLSYPLAASSVMSVAVFGVRRSLTGTSPLLTLIAMVATGILTYSVTVLVLNWKFQWGMERHLQMVKKAIQS